jgi:hypothetical protein
VVRVRARRANCTRRTGEQFGEEILADEGRVVYSHNAVAQGPCVVAFLRKSDYLAGCDAAATLALIEQLWLLGVECSKHDELLDFGGYKQIFLRVCKIMGSKTSFSVAGAANQAMDQWATEFEDHGEESQEDVIIQSDGQRVQLMKHDHFVASMYELADTFANGVDSATLDRHFFQTLLDESTEEIPTETGVTIEGTIGPRRRFRPLPSVAYCMQDLADTKDGLGRSEKKDRLKRSKEWEKDHARGAKGKGGFAKALKMAVKSPERKRAGPRRGDAEKLAREAEEKYHRDLFNRLDTDGSGSLDKDELMQLSTQLLGREVGTEGKVHSPNISTYRVVREVGLHVTFVWLQNRAGCSDAGDGCIR